MWLITDHLQEDGNCSRPGHQVDYFPNDTFPMLDVHRTNQFKGNMYQVDRFGCRPVSVYIRLVIFDSGYEDVKVINYQASNQFKYPVRIFSYPVIPFNGATFEQAPKEATTFLTMISCCMVPTRFIKIMYVSTERAIEGTNMRIVSVTMNVTKKVEGIEVPDPYRQDNIFIHLGRINGNWLEQECLRTHSIEDLAGNRIIEDIDLPEDRNLWRMNEMPFPMKRNPEIIMHAIIMGYVWSQRIARYQISLWEELYNGTQLRPSVVTSDYVGDGFKPDFLP